jgi:hypothetical protein
MGVMRNAHRYVWGNLRRINCLGDINVDGKIILKRILV